MINREFDEFLKGKLNDSMKGVNPNWEKMSQKVDNWEQNEMLEQEASFDAIIKGKLVQHEVDYIPEKWEEFESTIPGRFSRARMLIYSQLSGAAILLLLLMLLVQLYPIDRQPFEEIVELKIQETPKSEAIVGLRGDEQYDDLIIANSRSEMLSENRNERKVVVLKEDQQAEEGRTLFKKKSIDQIVYEEESMENSTQENRHIDQNVAFSNEERNYKGVGINSHQLESITIEVTDQEKTEIIKSNMGSDVLEVGTEVGSVILGDEEQLHSNSEDLVHTPDNEKIENIEVINEVALGDNPIDRSVPADKVNVSPDVLKEGKSKSTGNWQIGAYVSPQLFMISSAYDELMNEPGYKRNILDVGFGLNISYQKNNWAISTGIEYNELTYEPRFYEEYVPDINTYLSLENISFSMIQIPIHLQYTLLNKNKWRSYVKAGVSLTTLMDASYKVKERNNELVALINDLKTNPKYQLANLSKKDYDNGVFRGGDPGNNFILNLDFGLGLEYSINDKAYCFVEPVAHISFPEMLVGPNNDQLHRFALNTGVKYSLN